ncbi:MAG: glycosyltransferase family 9 protein [Chloroherpetonaceae bacterium]|nr:glycosyltransferase family 9 protein [Chloroherpetonaceae bacterium]
MKLNHFISDVKEAVFRLKLALIASFNRKAGRTSNSLLIALLLKFLELKFNKASISIPLELSQIKKILIFRGDQIGDMIVFTSALSALKSILPKSSIHIWASASNEIILRYNPNVEKIFSVSLTEESINKNIAQCQMESYDLLIDVSFWEHYLTASIAQKINPKAITVVLDNKEGKRELYLKKMYHAVLLPKGLNWAEEYHLAMLELFGVNEPKSVKTSIFISDIEANAVSKFLNTHKINDSFIILNLSARESCKKWGAKNSIEFLIRYCQDLLPHSQLPIIITAAPNDSSDVLELQRTISNPNIYYYPFTSNFLEIVELINRSIGCLSPDTAFVHACAAMNTPILVLCTTKSTTAQWLPLTEKKIVLWAPHNHDTSAIPVETVYLAFQQLLNQFIIKKV